MATKKIAPEPPRRHCSIRNSRTLSQEGTQINQATNANMYYGPSGVQCPGSAIHSHLPYLQQQASQPIYANYATIQQTTAEIHCEKFHDNKVRQTNQLVEFSKSYCPKIVFQLYTVQLQH